MHPLLPPGLFNTISSNMFHLPVPWLEKILRPIVVYLALIIFLRLFGKRELAQLNPFDLVVLLSLSNTVQNAIIGDDNSVTGGILGAFSLLAINWALMWVLYRAPKLNAALEGEPTTLIRDGVVDLAALKSQALTEIELYSVLNKNNFSEPAEVALCVLEPNGTFYLKAKTPSFQQMERTELLNALAQLSAEVKALRGDLTPRTSA
jgi:uncharacterized membrane protein YcaP (DUF421 family)